MRHFSIFFTIPDRLLTTIIQILTPEVSDLKISQIESVSKLNGTAPKRTYTKRGSKNEVIVMSILADGEPHKRQEIENALEKNGRSATSFSPLRSKLLSSGKMRLLDAGTYIKA
jgi:hypothetical protein